MGVAGAGNSLTQLGIIDPRDYGARTDGVTDCTAALNAAMIAASPGKTIYFPPGNWHFAGNVTCQPDVTLLGSQRDLLGPQYTQYTPPIDPTTTGTVFSITGGAGTTSASATAFLTPSIFATTIEGISFYYPNQGSFDAGNIVGYPYTIGSPYASPVGTMQSYQVAIKDCCFINSYQAIRLWSAWPFTIRDCSISAAVNGIWIDQVQDTSIIDNVRVEPIGFLTPGGTAWYAYSQANLIAYRIGRVDSLILTNSMSFPPKIGVLVERSIHTDTVATRPWFLMSNCVIDLADICLDIQSVPSQGIRVTNCSMSALNGTPNCIGVRLGSDAGAEGGVFTLTNTQVVASFPVRIAAGRSRYIGCTFGQGAGASILATGGDVAAIGCDFQDVQPQMTFSGGGKAIFANNTTASNGVSVTGVTASNCV